MQNQAGAIRYLRRAIVDRRWLLPSAILALILLVPYLWAFLILAALLIWLAWPRTATAQADDAIRGFLARWRIRAVARPLTTTADLDEPALVMSARRPSVRAVVAVSDGDALCGVIGPRQLAHRPNGRNMRCRDVMIPVGDIELLGADAPAAEAVPQLSRFGFAVVSGSGPLRYVEIDDLLQAILLAEAVKRTVRNSPGTKGRRR